MRLKRSWWLFGALLLAALGCASTPSDDEASGAGVSNVVERSTTEEAGQPPLSAPRAKHRPGAEVPSPPDEDDEP